METTFRVPIYMIMGFLESGKTSFMNYTIKQEYFQIEEPTLLILCEEGEEEYDKMDLLSRNTFIEVIDEPADLTLEKLAKFEQKYHPDRVLLEYNGFWDIKNFYQMKLPEGWGITQEIVTVDGSTFAEYMKNMKSIFIEMVKNADMVLFNRCKSELPLASYRRSIKVVNPSAEMLFEGPDGEVTDIFKNELPYDLEKNPIVIDDVDFGIFFIDVRDNPDKYKGKTVQFTGKVFKSKKLDSGYFMPARPAMTCCADDISHIGYICYSKEAASLTSKRWVQVTAEVRWEKSPMYRDKGPVLYAKKIKKTKAPKEEMVYFN